MNKKSVNKSIFKKDVFISITGIQRVDGETDSVELLTCGSFYRKADSFYLTYEESETTGYQGCKTTLQVEDASNRVTMLRAGTTNTRLVIEKGRRHQCHYDTGFGSFMVGISGDNVKSTLSEGGGELDFSYSMDINTALTSENRVIISIKDRIKESTTPC